MKYEGSLHNDVFLYGTAATLTANFSLHDTANYSSDLSATDITGKSADLGPLKNNGGSTETELSSKKSPVIRGSA